MHAVAAVALILAGACPAGGARSAVAYLRGSELHLLELAGCRDRVLARGAGGPVRFSADGRWIAFGAAAVVSTRGGRVLYPLPGAAAWAWSPERDAIAAVTTHGAVVLGGPGLRLRRLVPDGWGAERIAFARDGTLAVARLVRRGRSYRLELWSFVGPGLAPRRHRPLATGPEQATPRAATWSPDGRSLFFWSYPDHAISAALDGLPLEVAGPAGAQRLARAVLVADDFLSWCGERLVFVAGFDRYTTRAKRLVVGAEAAGRWRTRELSRDRSRSWVSPACSPDGRSVVAAAGRSWIERRFGQERRSLWVLSLTGGSRRKLTQPSRGRTDEAPRWSGDGRYVLFVRSGPTSANASARGRLYLVRVRDRRLLGPLAEVGPTGNYYGHYGWSGLLDWSDRA